MNTEKLPSNIKQGIDDVIAVAISRPFIEYGTIAILVISWIVKLILWFTPYNTLKHFGIDVHALTVETVWSFIAGLTLLVLIVLQRGIYSNPKLFWGSAIAAGTLSTSILLVLLVLGILGKYFGLEFGGPAHPETLSFVLTSSLPIIA